jgi:hypothetical protein
MPVKKRRAKHRTLDRLKREELFYGPGTCLLAGAGYYQWHHGPAAIIGETGGFFGSYPTRASSA